MRKMTDSISVKVKYKLFGGNKMAYVQLKMLWENDEKSQKDIVLPEGIGIETFSQRKSALDDWLDLVQYGLTDGRMDKDCYDRCMTNMKNYDENKCFFLVKDDVAVATITVICDHETKEGYIHMVACDPKFRGQGLGTLLNDIAVHTLKKEGMKTAYLTTDDFRIAAIKSYLRCGFLPDLSTDDFRTRWEKIYEQIK